MTDKALLGLDGRTALVTGAGQGVGRQVALTLAEHGASVIVNDFVEDRAKKVAMEVIDRGGKAVPAACDVTDYDAVASMAHASAGALGPVDILVNNAGNAGALAGNLTDATPFWETDPKDWDPWIGTNFFGVLNVTRAVLPGMVERGWGRLITVVSDAGRVGEPNFVVYGGAKAGAAGFSRGLAKAVGRHGVTANCVSLSTMNTPGVAAFLSDPAAVKRMLSGYSIRRLGEPEDAANMILFLASGAASWITGQTYPVNGGYSSAV
jgi:3-oxoacyl-[acyl-carrier protein] reductase